MLSTTFDRQEKLVNESDRRDGRPGCQYRGILQRGCPK
jgi:hypothetical protein